MRVLCFFKSHGLYFLCHRRWGYLLRGKKEAEKRKKCLKQEDPEKQEQVFLVRGTVGYR